MNFSEKLVKLRKENKMSQEDLAASLDVICIKMGKWTNVSRNGQITCNMQNI